MIECPRCKARYPDEESPAFCGECGTKIPGREPMVAPQADPLVGMVVDGRYRIIDLIGRGGMGAVYRVEHVKMGKVMAMKILHGELSQNSELMKRFKREAETVSRLTHINTVSVFDFGSFQGLTYLVMEYIDGQDLSQVLRFEGPIPFLRAAGIIIQVCSALNEAHSKNIVHRDLKPENILVGNRDEDEDFVKVLDFGLAKLRDVHCKTRLTAQGSLVGTPYYMAPEHIRGELVDQRSDIYALGAVMYKLLTGETPFSAATPMGVITKHLTEDPESVSTRFPRLAIPQIADVIILKAMSKRPEDRYQSADELRRCLADAIESILPGSNYRRFSSLGDVSGQISREMAAGGSRPRIPTALDATAPVGAPAMGGFGRGASVLDSSANEPAQKEGTAPVTKLPSEKAPVTKLPSEKAPVTNLPSEKAPVTKLPSEKASTAQSALSKSALSKSVNIGSRKVEIGTKNDFIQFERKLRGKRIASIVVALLFVVLLIVSGIMYVLVSGRDDSNPVLETEPNDTPAEADRLVVNTPLDAYIKGDSPQGDIDWYRLSGPDLSSWMVAVEVTSVPGLDIALQLVDPNLSEPLATANKAEQGGSETIPATLVSAPDVYLMVQEVRAPGIPPGSFPSTPYKIVYQQYDAASFEKEPNNSIASATRALVGQTQSGTLGEGDKIDWYCGPAGRTIKTVQVTGIPGADIKLNLRLGPKSEALVVNNGGIGQGEGVSLPSGPGPTCAGVGQETPSKGDTAPIISGQYQILFQ